MSGKVRRKLHYVKVPSYFHLARLRARKQRRALRSLWQWIRVKSKLWQRKPIQQKHSQQQSEFFSKLPPELRLEIFHYLFPQRVLITRSSQDETYVALQLGSDQQIREEGIRFLQYSRSADNHNQGYTPRRVNAVPLLRTCYTA